MFETLLIMKLKIWRDIQSLIVAIFITSICMHNHKTVPDHQQQLFQCHAVRSCRGNSWKRFAPIGQHNKWTHDGIDEMDAASHIQNLQTGANLIFAIQCHLYSHLLGTDRIFAIAKCIIRTSVAQQSAVVSLVISSSAHTLGLHRYRVVHLCFNVDMSI